MTRRGAGGAEGGRFIQSKEGLFKAGYSLRKRMKVALADS
jgi:hypothetical protein